MAVQCVPLDQVLASSAPANRPPTVCCCAHPKGFVQATKMDAAFTRFNVRTEYVKLLDGGVFVRRDASTGEIITRITVLEVRSSGGKYVTADGCGNCPGCIRLITTTPDLCEYCTLCHKVCLLCTDDLVGVVSSQKVGETVVERVQGARREHGWL